MGEGALKAREIFAHWLHFLLFSELKIIKVLYTKHADTSLCSTLISLYSN